MYVSFKTTSICFWYNNSCYASCLFVSGLARIQKPYLLNEGCVLKNSLLNMFSLHKKNHIYVKLAIFLENLHNFFFGFMCLLIRTSSFFLNLHIQKYIKEIKKSVARTDVTFSRLSNYYAFRNISVNLILQNVIHIVLSGRLCNWKKPEKVQVIRSGFVLKALQV